MTDDPVSLRPASDADRESVTRIFDGANPAWATSAAHYRRGPRPDPVNGVSLVAERSGSVIGAARANEALEGLLPRPGLFSARVAVDSAVTGGGVGSRLWKALREWLDGQSKTNAVHSWSDRDDERTNAIADHWHFERRSDSIEEPSDLDGDEPWAWHYELLLCGRPAEQRPVPAGVAVSPLPEVLDDPVLLGSLHEAHEECRNDVPAWERYESRRLAEFAAAQHERVANGGIGLVAHRGSEVLAATFAERAAFVPMLHNDFTMVRRTARGRGLGLTVKSRLIDEAAAARIQRITTEVRTDNRPMLAINQALGFRRIAMRQLSWTLSADTA